MTPANLRNRLASLLLGALALLLAGCAIPPRGPIVKHIIERYPDGTIKRETWSDQAFTRGFYFFADPNLQAINAWHTNQSALGGCSHFTAGSLTITVNSNIVPAISAAGTAVGNVIGAAAKSAAE